LANNRENCMIEMDWIGLDTPGVLILGKIVLWTYFYEQRESSYW